jgi:hypothetical protein
LQLADLAVEFPPMQIKKEGAGPKADPSLFSAIAT